MHLHVLNSHQIGGSHPRAPWARTRAGAGALPHPKSHADSYTYWDVLLFENQRHVLCCPPFMVKRLRCEVVVVAAPPIQVQKCKP